MEERALLNEIFLSLQLELSSQLSSVIECDLEIQAEIKHFVLQVTFGHGICQSERDNPEHLKLVLNSKVGEENGDCHNNLKVKIGVNL